MNTFSLLSYSVGANAPQAGILIDGQVFDAAPALTDSVVQSGGFSVLQILEHWERSEQQLQGYADGLRAQHTVGLALGEVQLHSPLLYPGAVYCAGANYRDHVAEMAKANNLTLETDVRGKGIPPWHFLRPSQSCIVGNNGTTARPVGSKKLDWEAELVAVIGRRASNVDAENALEYVAGYTIANDLSARDLFRRDKVAPGSPFYFDWLGHKGFQGSCPLGPWLTPASAIPDPQSLGIRLWVNDALKQDSNTNEMIYTVAEQIAHLSKQVTLQPGDIILTGTPAGVGAARNEFLQPGDHVRIAIEGLGELRTLIN